MTSPLDPIAIIGMSCRFPGAADIEAFWDQLVNGRQAIGQYPGGRLAEMDRAYDRQATAGIRVPCLQGGFLDDIQLFDAEFFGISPREAEFLDPQQRLLLEVAWEAVEDAGLPRESILPCNAGVFVGMQGSDFETSVMVHAGSNFNLHQATGTAPHAASGRLSFAFDARGPSVTVDTACSSALVAVHMARRALLDGECELALAAAARVMLRPEGIIAFWNANALAPDCRIKFGDAQANGFVKSEGAACIVLKRLSAAQRDGDRIHAILRGTAVNNDGRSSGLLVQPSVLGQHELIRLALADAGVSACDLQYIEAHGTGTAVGDPVELEAIGRVMKEAGRMSPCLVGSVKTNIGHTESAAGLAGLLKVILAINRRTLPASLNCTEPSPKVAWEDLPIRIHRQTTPWPGESPALAGVSSFGLTGTNAHAIVQQPPAPSAQEAPEPKSGCYLLPISAHSETALRDLARNYAQAADQLPRIADVCYTASVRRTHLRNRLALVFRDRQQLRERLQDFLDAEPNPWLWSGTAGPSKTFKTAFVFPGQGSQWQGMARGLLASEPVFRASIARLQQAIQPETGWRLCDLLEGSEAAPPLRAIHVIQPALFAVSVALAELWRSWGIEPQAVIGHSMGEIAAACVAGALKIEDAAAVICRRSRLMERVAGGAMALIELPAEKLARIVSQSQGAVSLAASNSPASSVLSGDSTAIGIILAELEKRGIFCRRINVDVASHSAQVDPLREDLLRAFSGLRPGTASLPIYSTVLDTIVDGSQMDAAYWADNLRSPVLFSSAVQRLIQDGFNTFIEMSPHPTLLNSIEAGLAHCEAEGLALPSLKREMDESAVMRGSLAAFYASGRPLDWSKLHARGGRVVSLPRYPFQRERYWPDFADAPQPEFRPGGHPLLGVRIQSSIDPGTSTWDMNLGPRAQAYLADHRVRDLIVLPAVAHLEIASAAAREAFGRDCRLEDVFIPQLLTIPPGGLRKVQLIVSMDSDDGGRFEIRASEEDGSWTLCSAGNIDASPAPEPAVEPLDQIRGRCSEVTADNIYRQLASCGLNYGPAFQTIRRIWDRDVETLAFVELSEDLQPEAVSYRIHPALFDGGLQNVFRFIQKSAQDDAAWVPTRIGGVRLSAEGGHKALIAHLREPATSADPGVMFAHAVIYTPEGSFVAELSDIEMRRLGAPAAAVPDDCIFQVIWEEIQPPQAAAAAGVWIILADNDGVGSDLADRLTSGGAKCLLVTPAADFSRQIDGNWHLRPQEITDYAALLQQAGASGPVRGVVHLWSLNSTGYAELGSQDAAWTTSTLTLLVQAISAANWSDPPKLWIVTRGANATSDADQVQIGQAPALGVGRAIVSEHPELSPTNVDLSATPDRAELERLAPMLASGLAEDQLAIRGSKVLVPRLEHYSVPQAPSRVLKTDAYRVALREPGTLDSLTLEPAARRAPQAGEVEIKVEAVGLNFRDVLKAMGLLTGVTAGDPRAIIAECAGSVMAVGSDVTEFRPGDQVAAFSDGKTMGLFSRFVTVAVKYVLPRMGLTALQAAGHIFTFDTAWLGLFELGKLQRGERVLIHSAAGGVGLAAVQLAQQTGAEIFATAGSPEKRAMLQSLGVRHVYDSRSLAFARQIMEETGGKGIDVVLNSLAGAAMIKSLLLLAPYGRFIELGKRDMLQNRRLPLASFINGISYQALDVSEHPLIAPTTRLMFRKIAADELRLLPMTVFPVERAVEGFHFMAQGKHVGKIVFAFPEEPMEVPIAQPVEGPRSDRTCLITGGLGGVGLLVAKWAVENSARSLLLTGRRPPSPAAQAAIEQMRHMGAQVDVVPADVSRQQDVEHLLEHIRQNMAPLGTVLHAAAVIDDALIKDMAPGQFAAVMAPKAAGAWNLHVQTRSLPLDAFVLFSSAAALVPQPGQASYAAANSFLDSLAMYRRSLHLPALSINWGGWNGVGLAKEAGTLRTIRGYSLRGIQPMEPALALGALGLALRANVPELVATPIHRARLAEASAGMRSPGLFAKLVCGNPEPSGRGASTLLKQLRDAASHEERVELIETLLRDQISRVLRLAPSRIERTRPLGEMGLDSLMAVELVNRLRSSLGVTLATTMVFNHPSVAKLAVHLLQKLGFTSPDGGMQHAGISEPAPAPEPFKDLDELSDAEALQSLVAARFAQA